MQSLSQGDSPFGGNQSGSRRLSALFLQVALLSGVADESRMGASKTPALKARSGQDQEFFHGRMRGLR